MKTCSPTPNHVSSLKPLPLPPTPVLPHSTSSLSLLQPPAAHLSPGEVTGYQVGYAEAPGTGTEDEEYRWKSVRGVALTAKVEGLRHYTTYRVTVRAVNQVGSGPPAQPVTVTTTQGGA